MNKNQEKRYLVRLLILCAGLVATGVWVSAWWLSFKLFATAAIVAISGGGSIDILTKGD